MLNIEKYFDCLVLVEYLLYSKLYLEVYLNVVFDLGVDFLECVMLEDLVNGMIVIKVVCMCFIVIFLVEYWVDFCWVLVDIQLELLE